MDFWQCWGDNTMKDWSGLTVDTFKEYLMTSAGPQVPSTTAPGLVTTTATTPPPVAPTPAPVDVMAITKAISAAMLVKSPASKTDIFMKNKGGRDEVKPLKEQQQ